MGLISPPFNAASITPTSIGAAPEVYKYTLRNSLPPEAYTLPVESWVYNDMRIPQGSSPNTSEYVITLPNEANLRFGNKVMICAEPATNVGSSRPVRIRRQNGDTLFYNAGGSGFISWSSLYEYQFSLGWTRIPFPSDIENKDFKNQPNGYAGLNASGKIPNAYLTNATALTIQSWNRNTSAIVGVTTTSAHNLTSGQTIIITGTTRATGLGSNIDGTWVVDGVFSSTQFTFIHPESLLATGAGGTIPTGGIFSSADYSKLLGIQQGAQVNVKPDWTAASGSATEILNKPTIPAAQVNSDWNATSGVAQILNRPLIPILLGHGSFSYSAGNSIRYFANIFDLSAVTTLVERGFKVPQSLTIKHAIFNSYIGGASVPVDHSGGFLRLRNKTQNSVSVIMFFNLNGLQSGRLGIFTASDLSIPMNATDEYVIDMETGTFTTAPTSVRQMLTLYY